MRNDLFLIAYADRFGGNFARLRSLLSNELKGCFSGIHILPFYYPIDGSDAGFDPIDHLSVDNRVGSWGELSQLSQDNHVMADVIVNHMSAHSPQFKARLTGADEYEDLFLTEEKIFPSGASEDELKAIYRPRPNRPFTRVELADGTKENFWTTFSEDQIDIDIESAAGAAYLESILVKLASAGVTHIRLDAAGYAIKRAGTSCFMLPETFEFIGNFTQKANQLNMKVLVESHAYYQDQIDLAKQVDYVYDFALPPLVLHTLLTANAEALKNWLGIAPRNAMTVLDTHDGIGVRDIGAESSRPGLLAPDEIDSLVETMHVNSNGESRKATGAAASNLDLYQVNCSFFDALGSNEQQYLIARAIQLFAPGVPQVYYAGLLAGHNDMDLLERSGVGRDINRHYYDEDQLQAALETPLVKAILKLLRLRRSHPAFGGEFRLLSSIESVLGLEWLQGSSSISLIVDLPKSTAVIHSDLDGCVSELSLCVDGLTDLV